MDRFIPVSVKHSSTQLLEVRAWARRSRGSHLLTGSSSLSFHQMRMFLLSQPYYRIFHCWTIPCSVFFLCSIVILLISEEVAALFYLYERGRMTSGLRLPRLEPRIQHLLFVWLWARCSKYLCLISLIIDEVFKAGLSSGSPGCPPQEAQAGLKAVFFLFRLSRCWHHRPEPPYLGRLSC